RLSDIDTGAVDRFATYDPSQGGASSRTQLVGELKRSGPGDDGDLTLSTYFVLRSLHLRQNFTGYLTDANGDGQQQVNDDIVLGGTGSYRRRLALLSPADELELGFFARTDWIEQSQRRIAVADNRVLGTEVDARVRAHDVGAYLDLGLHPLRRLTLRAGVRLDGLGFSTEDFGPLGTG